MAQIKKFPKSNLLVGSHYEFHAATVEMIKKATTTALHIIGKLAEYENAVVLQQKIINRNQQLAKTEDLAELDRKRDMQLGRLFTAIDMYARSLDYNESRKGKELRRVVKPYRGLATNERNKETAEIEGLLRDLAKPGDTAIAVAALQLEPVIQRVKDANDQFIALMNVRIMLEAEAHDDQLNGITTESQRKVIDAIYDKIVLTVNAFAIAEPTPVINTFVAEQNALVDEYRRVIAHLRPGGTGNETINKKPDAPDGPDGESEK